MTDDTTATTEDAVGELLERMSNAVTRLEALRAEHWDASERQRLHGKTEGVKLAASYVEEARGLLATARTRPTRDDLARAIASGYEPDHPTPNRHDYRAADAVLALLADQPETTTEWGVRFYGRGPFDVACDSREDAEAEVAAVEDKHAPAVLIRREVTAWTEVDQ